MASKPQSEQPIIIKKVKKGHGGHHGGAWKIAYADFVTAMMAFFLLMWLVTSVKQSDLKGISEYFKQPIKLAITGGKSIGERKFAIQGGGKDVTQEDGQVQKQNTIRTPVMDPKVAQRTVEKDEIKKLEALKKQLESVIAANPTLAAMKNQILLEITKEGLKVQMVDLQKRPMFATGSNQLEPHASEFLKQLAKILNQVPNRISITGHTDAAPYAYGNKDYSNWELSADRANASRRVLLQGGLQNDKVIKIVGSASAILLDKQNPLDPINRRISIIVLYKNAEESYLQQ